ncbi:MAG: hydrogenase maturation protease [Chloroflexi bacterium]|nr:hydrogenase maturation protease [Chloroflexota bacterium]
MDDGPGDALMGQRSPKNGRSRADDEDSGVSVGEPKRVLVAGVGNVLRGDDGFGLSVVQALAAAGDLPAGVRIVEIGTGGIGLVHELMDRYDALIVVDAVDRAGAPGALYVLEPVVPDVSALAVGECQELATDLHQAVPGRTLVLAKAVGVLPPLVRLVGCQPAETEELLIGLSAPVERAVPAALAAIRSIVASLTEPDAEELV